MTEPTSTAAPAATALRDYLSAPERDAAYVDACAEQAEAIVAGTLRTSSGAEVSGVPEELRARAVVEVAAELYARRGLRNGIATFGTADGDLQPVRVNRDPMHLARAILARYLGGPFA